MATLLFTDIAGSSEIAVELGDERWRRLQARHHAEVRRQLKRHGGHEVDTAGDGFFATFSSPAAGVRCADAVVKAVRELGLEVRAGLHIGEAELTGEKVSGIAVTTAARVAALAGAGQVLATDTIVHLTAGSGLTFSDLGTRELKGVPGTWKLSRLTAIDGQQIGETARPGRRATGTGPFEPAAGSEEVAISRVAGRTRGPRRRRGGWDLARSRPIRCERDVADRTSGAGCRRGARRRIW